MLNKLLTITALCLYGSVAMAQNCAITIEGNDKMQFNTKEIKIDAGCKEFEVTLKHVGKLPKVAMGHAFALVKTADLKAVQDAGRLLGLASSFLPKDDARLIAHIDLIGGGETASVKFAVSKLKKGGDYTFFCPFTGHHVMMIGKVVVG